MISRRVLRIKVLKGMYGFVRGENKSLANAEKELRLSIQKTYDLYHYLFYFLPSLQAYAQSRIDLGLKKHLPTPEEKNPNTKFVDNKLIHQISDNASLIRFVNAHSGEVQDTKGIIKKMYESISSKDYFKNYMSNPERSFAEDKELVVEILSNEFEGFSDLEELLEDKSIYWTDEMEFIVGMILRLTKTIKEDKPFNIPPLYKNEDDERFAGNLFRCSVVNHDEYSNLLKKTITNWEIERVAFIDTIILTIAVAEILNFPAIPLKVTFDEYLELSHYYSTENSSNFINGVLDKLVQDLKTEGKLIKE